MDHVCDDDWQVVVAARRRSAPCLTACASRHRSASGHSRARGCVERSCRRRRLDALRGRRPRARLAHHLETDDGALIHMTSFGLRHGPPEVLAALARGESVDPRRTTSGPLPASNQPPQVRVSESTRRRVERRPARRRSHLHDRRDPIGPRVRETGRRDVLKIPRATLADAFPYPSWPPLPHPATGELPCVCVL